MSNDTHRSQEAAVFAPHCALVVLHTPLRCVEWDTHRIRIPAAGSRAYRPCGFDSRREHLNYNPSPVYYEDGSVLSRMLNGWY